MGNVIAWIRYTSFSMMCKSHMKIIVKKNSIYKEVFIQDGNTTISTGLLDKDEQEALIFDLQSAIEDLSDKFIR